MSTYHFKATGGTGTFEQLNPSLERLKNTNDIEGWEVHTFNSNEVLEIVTNKLSPEEVKHLLRESGVDAEFTRAPDAG
jgi:hypothetical protein